MSRFKSAKHFASWLGLCPGTKISGGKVLSSASKRTANRAAQALRLAATALRSSRSALGAYYRRLCARLDRAKAITAAAHKLARLIYTMLTKGSAYVDRGQNYYEERYRQRVLHHLTRRAQKLGFHLTPIQHVFRVVALDGHHEAGVHRASRASLRLKFRNASDDIHPLHLHRHSFELTRIGGKPTAGVIKDVVMLGGFQELEFDFVADNPGLTLFHYHQQLHMDFGFMALFNYA